MDYEKKYKEAQKWIESIYSELSHEQQMEAEAFFPELKESEDEKIRKEILHFIKKRDRSGCDYDYDKWIAWLEKQGKKETLCDKCRKEHPSHSCQDITALGRCALEKQDEQKKSYNVCDSSMMDNKKSPYGEKRDFGYFEEKPADKVGTKFKVGDWITTTDEEGNVTTEKIIEFWGDKVLLIDTNGFYSLWPKHELNYYHIWTINDAKDGDVLACPLPKGCESGEQIFIFKGINSRDYVDNCIEYYCRVYEGVFYENENGNGYMGTTSSPLYPATKEQRNILFAKMKEAGYEWNTEKKELKKISQRMVSAEAKEALYDKPAWSEEDEDAIRMAIIALEDMYDEDAPNTTYGGYNLPFNKAAERLKSIKERI